MDTTFDYLTLIGLLLLIQPFGYINSIKIGDKQQQQQQINFNDNSILRDSNKNNNLNNLNINNQNNYHNRYETVNEDNQFIKIANNNNNNNNDNEMLNNNNNNNYVNDSDDDSDKTLQLNLTDQVKLLTKQLNALMMRRREDYKLLENNLKKSLRKSTLNNIENVDMDIHNELEQMRHEIKDIRSGIGIGNKEKLTVEWLTQSIAEMRKELTELQDIANNASKDINRRSQNFEDMATVKNDFQQYRLELEALKERQQTSEIFIRELREEMLQKEDDFWQVLRKQQHHQQQQQNQDSVDKSITKSNDYNNIEPEADHKMRHQRYIRQQIHDLDISQRQLKQQLNELQYHRIGDRVRNIEIEQRRLANANFNLSRQIAGLDKLHSSMLELLEDVNGIQSKFDKTIPDLKREISKLEFTSAQLTSEQNLIKEEGNNVAKSIQAMAVSVSALQDERDHFKDIPNSVKKLQENVERLESVMKSQKSIVHRRIEKMELEAQPKHHKSINNPITLNTNSNNINHNTEVANNLVQQLQSVELQYESIINKLPTDCSQVEMSNFNDISTNPINNVNNNNGGLFLIAPAGQHRPVMAYCNNDGWTTIQRRYDGSVDFNRSWESYGQGFGSPSGEFWIGNDMLHHLTSDNCTKLKIIMQDIYDNIWYANYNYFYISSKLDGYRLNINNYNGNASDALDYQNHMEFSAIDVDRDISNTHCAANYEGGWWFSHCQHANLNGRYNLGLTWFDASRNEWIAVKSSQMMITKNQQCYMDNINKNSDSSSSSSSNSWINNNSKSDHHNNNNNNILIINDDTINESSSLSSLITENPLKTADDKTQLTIENSLIRTTTTITSVV